MSESKPPRSSSVPPPRLWEPCVGMGYSLGRFLKETFRFLVLFALFVVYTLLILILTLLVTILPREEYPWAPSKPPEAPSAEVPSPDLP